MLNDLVNLIQDLINISTFQETWRNIEYQNISEIRKNIKGLIRVCINWVIVVVNIPEFGKHFKHFSRHFMNTTVTMKVQIFLKINEETKVTSSSIEQYFQR